MSADPPLIVRVLLNYFPAWEPPRDSGKEWMTCLCPFHGDSRPSAAVSYKHNAFKCHACPAKGDAYGIIMKRERVNFRAAVRYAETEFDGGGLPLSGSPTRKPRRRLFGESGI